MPPKNSKTPKTVQDDGTTTDHRLPVRVPDRAQLTALTKQVMNSYHNNPELKANLLAQVEKHRIADGLSSGDPVGCCIESLNRLNGSRDTHNDHAAIAAGLGIDIQLCYLLESIFAGLRDEEAMLWPGRFCAALPIGADTSLVWPKFAIWLLSDPQSGVCRLAEGKTLASMEK